MSKQYIYSIKKRSGYADKTKTVYEVMCRMPHYKSYPVAVGGLDNWIHDNEEEALFDCEQRIINKLSEGHQASYEIFDYEAYRDTL